MIMRPGALKVGDRVRHDLSGTEGVVTGLLTKRGHKGMQVDYARVRLNGGSTVEHPWATLTKL